MSWEIVAEVGSPLCALLLLLDPLEPSPPHSYGFCELPNTFPVNFFSA